MDSEMNIEELIESHKKISKINHDVAIKIDRESNHMCKICNKSVTSFCNSHSIPYSVFNHMNLVNGEIIPSYNASMKKIMTKVERGKLNSGIFKMICNECDQKYFADLDNFDVINGKWNNNILKLQAQRINLYHIYRMKEVSYTIYEMFEGKLTKEQIENEKKGINNTIKIFNQIFNKYKDNSNNFNIIFDKTLDYEVNFSTACVVPMIFNIYLDCVVMNKKNIILKIESHQINKENYFNVVYMGKEQNNYMYIIVFPYNGKTRVTVFCDEDSIASLFLKIDIDNLPVNKILLYISSTLLILGRNMYGNKEFMAAFRKGCKIFTKQFYEKYNGYEIPLKSTSEIKEAYIYLYNNNINLFDK